MEASVAQAGGVMWPCGCVMCVHSVIAALELGVLLAFVSRRETGRLTVD